MKTFIEYAAIKENKSTKDVFQWVAEALNQPFRGLGRSMGRSMGGGDDLAMKMKAEFGKAPYYVDEHLIDLMLAGRKSPMGMYDVKNQILAKYGASIFASMEEFMRSGGKTDLNAQQASDAADFASGGGNFR